MRAFAQRLRCLSEGHSHTLLRRTLPLVAAAVLALFTASAAEAQPPLRIVLLPALIAEAADQVLPMRFNQPADPADIIGQQLTLTELLYCGSDHRGSGRLIGVLDEGNAPLRARSLEASDCDQPLATIAARELRFPGAPEWVEAARLRLTWQPWRLTLAIAEAAGAARQGYTAPNLRSVAQAVYFPSAALQPLTGPGQNLRFDLAIGFRRAGIVIDAYPSGTARDPAASFPSDDALDAQIQAAPLTANVIAAARYGFINQMLAIYSPAFEVPVSIQGLSATLLAHGLSVNGGDNQLTLTGKVISENLTYDSKVDCAGGDLAVQQIAMEAAGVNCAQPDMMSWLQCQAGHGLAAALTAYYQNQPFHVSTRSQPLHFTFSGTDYEAYFTGLKTSSHGGVLSEAGQSVLQRASCQPAVQHGSTN